MGTPFSSVYEYFMQMITDWRLISLYQNSEIAFSNYTRVWLLLAIDDFKICKESLAVSSDSFVGEISAENQKILALIMMKYWMMKEVNDVMQFTLHVQDRDFKMFSEAQNLTAKTTNLTLIEERISQRLVDYGIEHIPMSEWLSGNFYQA